MTIWIAFFRGINVGGNNIVPMKELSRLLEDAGCSNIKTYIQSGNAIFRSAEKDASKITSQDPQSARKTI